MLESGYIEQMIEGDWLSPFPQLRRTERPDVVAASLVEGNVAIICDNTPFALLAPATLLSLFQSPEDYYERWYIASMIRILRFTAAFFAFTFPALYIAMTTFHPGMLPTDLALSIAAAREGVPFSAVLEALIMVFALEVLREAGVRLPGPIGQTIGIVGGLVVGEAAVRAGIVSPIMVIVVACKCHIILCHSQLQCCHRVSSVDLHFDSTGFRCRVLWDNARTFRADNSLSDS